MALTAGDIGYRYLLRVLEQEGYSQVIYEMNARSDVPGYGFQLARGATALTESWAALRDVSNNHMMLGHLMEWFYSGIGGIRQFPGSKAYEHILISPEITGDIAWAEVSHKSVKGEIKCYWALTDGILKMKITIPANSIATVRIPQPDPEKINVNSIPLNSCGLIRIAEGPENMTSCTVASGDYSFEASISVNNGDEK